MFSEAVSDHLDTDRHACLVLSARNGDPRQTAEVDGNGIDIAKIHGKRVLETFSDLWCCVRSSRCKDHIIFIKSTIKFLFDQGFGTKCFQVISIVITGT